MWQLPVKLPLAPPSSIGAYPDPELDPPDYPTGTKSYFGLLVFTVPCTVLRVLPICSADWMAECSVAGR